MVSRDRIALSIDSNIVSIKEIAAVAKDLWNLGATCSTVVLCAVEVIQTLLSNISSESFLQNYVLEG